jgi:anti-anti-sigma factor
MSSVSDRGGFEGLNVVVDDHDATRTVRPCGEIDIATVPFVHASLAAALSDGFRSVVLDLSDTTFIDSSGIALALDAFERATSRGIGFRVVPGPDHVHRAFVICGLVDVLPFAEQANPSHQDTEVC